MRRISKITWVTVMLCTIMVYSIATAEMYDFTGYTLSSMLEMRTQLNQAIADRIVRESSTLSAAGSYDGEILFRGIPWGTSASDVRAKLASDRMVGSSVDIDNDDYIYAWKIAEDMYIQSNAGASITVYDFPSSFSIAGYSLKSAHFYCTYGYTEDMVDRSVDGSQFMMAEITFDIADIELVYADLTNKLSSLYGQPEEVVDNNHYMILTGDSKDYTQYNSWMVWYGANDTGVFIYKTYKMEDNSTIIRNPELTLVYGKVNGKQYLDGLSQAIENEKKAQDALKQQQNSDNVDGL